MTQFFPLRLDNAANIYPASLSKRYASLYRMSITLTEPVDSGILQESMTVVSHRIPTFRCGLKSGSFWWYLRPLEKDPVVTPLSPLRRFRFEDYGGHLFRVSADGCRIVLDVFHALADGKGGEIFLLTLTGEYLRRRYGIDLRYDELVKDPKDSVRLSEVEDAFKTVFTGQKGSLEKNDKAYHIKGGLIPFCGLNDIRIVIPVGKLSARCREKSCTVTEFMTAALLEALQREYLSDGSKGKKHFLKVTVPIDLRPVYDCSTLRNFSTYMNLGHDVEAGALSFDELLALVRQQKESALRQEELEPKIAANVALEESLLVRCIPLGIKRFIIDLICRMHGDKFCSYTLSNLGRVTLPETMTPFVKEMDFTLGKQRGNSGAASCVTFGDRLFLNLSRKIVRKDFERYFMEILDREGVPFEMTEEVLA